MKKILILLFVLLIAFPGVEKAYGTSSYSAHNPKKVFRNGYAWSGHSSKDFATQWAQDVEDVATLGYNLGTGKVYYVDSGVLSEGDGTSWSAARDTIDEAINLCTADRGDFILVAQGHNEVVAASGIVCDIAGVTIHGMGSGSLKPMLDYDAATGNTWVSADNVTLVNLRFVSGITGGEVAVVASSGADYFTLRGCEFGYGEAWKTDEFLTAVKFYTNNAAQGGHGLVEGCTFAADQAGAAQAVSFEACSGIIFRNNNITGNYSVADIKNTAGAINVEVYDNTIINGHLNVTGGLNAQPVLEFAATTAGLIKHNDFAALLGVQSMRVADDCTFIGNFVTTSAGDEFSGFYESLFTASFTTGVGSGNGVASQVAD